MCVRACVYACVLCFFYACEGVIVCFCACGYRVRVCQIHDTHRDSVSALLRLLFFKKSNSCVCVRVCLCVCVCLLCEKQRWIVCVCVCVRVGV